MPRFPIFLSSIELDVNKTCMYDGHNTWINLVILEHWLDFSQHHTCVADLPPYWAVRRYTLGGTVHHFSPLKPVSAKSFFSFEISMVSLTNYIYLQTNKETIIDRPEQPGFRASYAKQQTNIVSFPT